ncbi:hypothetical protein QL996_13575 [Planococcus sp. APC 4015]|nr:hypothetical protein [Planococcus sp. APC 4015]
MMRPRTPRRTVDRRHLSQRFLQLLPLVVTAALVTGCAPTAEPAIPDGVGVSLMQLRSDVAARQAQVRVVNGTDAAIEIGDVAVADDRFADAAQRADPGRTTIVRPGATVDIRVQLPAMACETDAGAPTVALTLPTGVARGPIDDTLGVIAPLHERECRAERLAEDVSLTFADFEPSANPAPARLDLVVETTGGGEALVTGIRPTNLLMFDGLGGAPLPLDIDSASAGVGVVPLPVVPQRCDPHAVQEDKRGTVFTVDVEIDGEPGVIELAADDELRGRILTWVSAWCA